MNATDTHHQANTRLLRMPQVLDRVGLAGERCRQLVAEQVEQQRRTA